MDQVLLEFEYKFRCYSAKTEDRERKASQA